MSGIYQQYAASLENGLRSLYEIANAARAKGLDPALKPEPEVAKDLAELVEGLVGPKGVAQSIRELGEKLPREELAFKIAEETVYGKFGHMDTQSAAEQAVRTALAILTEGITAAPLQGIAKVAVKTNFDKTKYLAIYFAGPIRSAGGTDQALTLVIGDFVRRLLGLARFRPTAEEVSRFVEEMRLYERSVGRFQYHVTDNQLAAAIESIPVEVSGMESDPFEVQSFRNLPRVETNRVRGGALRVVNDGVIGRAAKVFTIVEKLGIEGWDWLGGIGEAKGTEEKWKRAGFMEDIIAGRPVFAFPSQPGGFRLRYGRARNTGLAAVGIHPLTMVILGQFLAGGTQVRIELPGKGGVVMPVDTIEPPVVLLKDNSVVRVSAQNIADVKDNVERILFLGDLLVSFGDFLYNNKNLRPAGYVEEWWTEELKQALSQRFEGCLETAASILGIPAEHLERLLSHPICTKPTAEEAISLAKQLGIPLHPYHTFLWSRATNDALQKLHIWLTDSRIEGEGEAFQVNGVLETEVKSALEHLCVPHKVDGARIVIEGGDALSFAASMGVHSASVAFDSTLSPLENLNRLSGLTIRDKAPTTVGARMGRPEKAKGREMKPRVHLLFPVGLAGGARRNLMAAAQKGLLAVELVKRKCPNCQKPTFRTKCPSCGVETILDWECPRCGKTVEGDRCPTCRTAARCYGQQSIHLKGIIDEACRQLALKPPDIVKGVKGLSNEKKIAENVEKGLLRAKEDLSVYRDGTVRFDATNAPLTHFSPAEVHVSVEQLRKLGYTMDRQGKSLTSMDQVCELKAQDVIIPSSCSRYFIKVAHFVDELLDKVYALPRFYRVEKPEDLVGHLIVGLAPHTSVGILGRIVGFTELSVCYAHPLWHSAKRRDCDGDEDAFMLALDTLLNFSKAYLSSQIGGIMDAPLFIIPLVNPKEVQRQAHEFDVADRYPLEFYEMTKETPAPSKASHLIDLIARRMGTEAQYEGYGYTMPVSDINQGNRESVYKKLKKMTDKLDGQLELAERIEAVDARQVALQVLNTHFLKDITGNLRAFSAQGFRCKQCGKRARRIPLSGRCPICGGLLALTVYRGGIEKYLEAARHLVEKYELPMHYLHRLELVQEEIVTLFEGRRPRQISLTEFA